MSESINIPKTGFSIPDIINGAALLKAAVSRQEFSQLSAMWENMRKNQPEDAVGNFGEELFFLLLDKATDPKVGAALERFICGLCDLTPEAYKKYDILDMWEDLQSYADPERWKGFFDSVRRMSRKKSLISVSGAMGASASSPL